MRRSVVLLLVALALATRVHAESVVDRIVGPTSTGAPLALNGVGVHTIGVLAFAAGVPIGLELAGRSVTQPQVITATGVRLRVVLDALVAAEPRYEWREDDGVVVIRPREAWIRNDLILDIPVVAVKRADIQAIDAVVIVRHLFDQSGVPTGLSDTKRFSIDLPPGRLIDFLNGIVRAHGSLAWMLDPVSRDSSVGFIDFIADASGLGVGIPRSIVDQPRVLGLGSSPQAWVEDAGRSPLDRIVGPNRDGEPLVVSGIFRLPELAAAAGVPIGVQLARPANPADTPTVSVAATGIPLRAVLSTLVAQDRRYEWREMGGVIVVRPTDAWTDFDDPLSKRVDMVRLENATVSEAIDAVLSVFGSFARRAPLGDVRRITVHLPGATRLDLLNAIVRAHGELCWQWEGLAQRDPYAPEYSHSVSFTLFGGAGLGFAVP